MSQNIKNVNKRLDKLPQFYNNMLISTRKGDADKFIDQFKKNIRHGRLNLESLATKTIDSKERQGLPKPTIPLYGFGDWSDNSYINMFLLKRLSKGWKAYPRWAKHHSANMTLRQLFEIHEYGRTIKRGETLIRIPPRPAAWETYRQVLNSIKKKEVGKVKKAITEYIKTGNERLINEISKYSPENIE